ncbi:MAG: glycosyltransferase family 4 protein [bacterium]|nr:glycosyltransferase family 4 protein [bacterium]
MKDRNVTIATSPAGTARKLKILICLLYYFPHRTGLTIHVQRVAEALVKRGHEVTVLTARYNQTLPRDDVTLHEGVRIVRLWAPIKISRGMVMPAYPLAIYDLLRTHDVVSIHTPMLETAVVSIAAALTGHKVLVTHHGDLVLPKDGGWFNRFIEWMVFAMYRFMAARAGKLFAYSQDYANYSAYLKPFLDKTEVIYPPISIPTPNPEKVAALRVAWSHEGGPIIGFAGRFVEEKRPDVLIKALDVINKTYPNARIVFAGEYDIPYETTWARHEHLVEQYRDQLHFLGLVPDMQDMANFYAACDVLALTSDTECFALVQVEAMLCGTPVVMTDIPGGRVPVQMTGMGKLARQGDPVSVGESLVEVLAHREAYVQSRSFIEQCFSFQETVDRYEKFFYEFARPPRQRKV